LSLYDDFNQVSEELASLKRILAAKEDAINSHRLQAQEDSTRLRNFRWENNPLAHDLEIVRNNLHEAHVAHANCEQRLLRAEEYEQLQEKFNGMKDRVDQIEDALKCMVCLLPMHATTQRDADTPPAKDVPKNGRNAVQDAPPAGKYTGTEEETGQSKTSQRSPLAPRSKKNL
jgi:hypothetical protein